MSAEKSGSRPYDKLRQVRSRERCMPCAGGRPGDPGRMAWYGTLRRVSTHGARIADAPLLLVMVRGAGAPLRGARPSPTHLGGAP
jgi:hypothetical protein